jgi:hypothetical protein
MLTITSHLIFAFTLNGRRFPWFALIVLISVVLYQLASGNLLKFNSKSTLARENYPKLYWTIIGIESGLALIVLYLGSLTL